MRDAVDRCVGAGDGGEFNTLGAGDRGDVLVPGDFSETYNGEADGGHHGCCVDKDIPERGDTIEMPLSH
jgi:hypothetical protein